MVVVVVVVSLGWPGNLEVKPSPAGATTIQPASTAATAGEGVGASVGMSVGMGVAMEAAVAASVGPAVEAAVEAAELHAEMRIGLASTMTIRRRTIGFLASRFK